MLNSWTILALAAAMLWALVNVADKYVVTFRIPDTSYYLLMQGVIGLLPALAILIIGDARAILQVSPEVAILCLLTGFLNAVFNILYLRALKISDTSVIAALSQIFPIFSVVIAHIFLDESYGLGVYLGIALIILGTVLATINKDYKFRLDNLNILWFMLPAALIIAVAYSLESFVLRTTSVASLFFWARVGFLLGAILPLFFSLRKMVIAVSWIRGLAPKLVIGIAALEIVNLIGTYLLNKAYSLGPLTIVSTLASIQPLFVFLVIWGINRLSHSTRFPDVTEGKLGVVRVLSLIFVIIGLVPINVALSQ